MALVKFTNGHRNGTAVSPFNDLFGTFFNNEPFLPNSMVSRVPAVNVSETDGAFLVELAAPGMKKEDFKISLEKDRLTVSADVKQETEVTDKKYNRKEFSYMAFSKTFTLPEIVDQNKITAEYTDGILAITVAKREEAQIQSREIVVK